jgi:hypothetical protein
MWILVVLAVGAPSESEPIRHVEAALCGHYIEVAGGNEPCRLVLRADLLLRKVL